MLGEGGLLKPFKFPSVYIFGLHIAYPAFSILLEEKKTSLAPLGSVPACNN